MDKESASKKTISVDEQHLQADVTLDLKGKKCPMTFVFTKLALEKMQPNQVLKVILDYEPSFTNVPRSVELQNLGTVVQECRDTKQIQTLWICKSLKTDRE